MNNIDSLLKRVSSSIHHGEPNYLSFDPKSFQVICILCAKESAKLNKEKFNIINPELSNVEESSSQKIQMPEKANSNQFCYKHKAEPFYSIVKNAHVKLTLLLNIINTQIRHLI